MFSKMEMTEIEGNLITSREINKTWSSCGRYPEAVVVSSLYCSTNINSPKHKTMKRRQFADFNQTDFIFCH